MNNIDEQEQEIIEEFTLLDGDMEMIINYVIELGDQLPSMPNEFKTDEHVVKGCQSKVWMNATLDDQGAVQFDADSNTAVTKGLVSLLVRVLSGQKAQSIMDAEINFPSKIGMNRFIGTQRSSGFNAMIKQMKLYALALSTKSQTDTK